MRGCTLVYLVCSVALVAPALARGQTPAPPAAQAAEPPSAIDTSRSLFEPTWNQFQLGGRLTSVDGDPARFQRFRDMRDGVLFTDARYQRADPGGRWLFQGAADNVGWRDQRYAASYERTGRFTITGLYDQIPQFYSVDTKTPFSMDGSPLQLNDATRRELR